MTPHVKIALIIAAGIIAAMGLYLYYTPYQQCVRAMHARDAQDTNPYAKFSRADPEITCLRTSS